MIESILQALIIAAIVAGATGYVSGRVMEVKINGLRETVKEMKDELQTIRKRLHEWAPHIGWIDQQRRWSGDERRK